MEFSGRTTALDHKRADWESHGKNIGRECIKKINWFEVQWSNCPVEIQDAIRKMWAYWELGNDHCIIKWSWEFMDDEDYPESCKAVGEFLKSKGFKEGDGEEIIIHWWW